MSASTHTTSHVTFTPEKLRRFKQAFEKAKMNPVTDVFTFDGREYVLGYAKYLITYLEAEFERENAQS